ncbi:MAG: signal peptidase I [Treponema sp.]|nr:signal peptidase I [Treponema sp.]
MTATRKRKIIKLALIGIAAGFFLRCFVFDILIVKGKSMSPAIEDGDVIFINRLAYGIAVPFGSTLFTSWNEPARDECVIYLYNNNIVVKRCAACGGEPLEYSHDTGYTLRTGGKEYPLSKKQYRLMSSIKQVPEGMILAIGDNAGVSVDSRDYGFVPVKNIIGRVICR